MSEPKYTTPQITYGPNPELIKMPSKEQQAVDREARLAKEAGFRAEIQAKYLKDKQERKRRRVKTGMKAVFAATILATAIKSGGLIDLSGDGFVGAGDVAAEAIDDNVNSDAESTVVNLFDRIDAEGYDGIVAEVEADKLAHGDSYASSDLIEATKRSIKEADSNTEALAALDTFMGEYGITAEFIDQPFNDKSDQFKQALDAYVDVFSVLPKELIAMSKLKTVMISSESSFNHSADGTFHGGTYYPDDNLIELVVRTDKTDATKEFGDIFTGNDSGYHSTVAHELGHALDEQLKLRSRLDESDITFDKDEKNAASNDMVWQHLIDRPDHISTYSLTSTDEHTAEVLSGLLSDSSHGLAAVEQTRRFTAGANAYALDMLAQLEEAHPGIAKILIANRMAL